MVQSEIPEIRIARDFLGYLLDGEWHSGFPIGVNIHPVVGCVHHGFVETREIEEKVKGCDRAFRITGAGRVALSSGLI
jgi:hypothetical protein